MTNDEMIMYDQMISYGIATAEEMNLVKNIKGGTWTEVYNAIVYVRLGYQTFEQWFEEMMEEE